MRKLLAFIGFVLLLLTFAALDDITTGNEPTLVGEWLIVTFTVFYFLGWAVYEVWKKRS